MKKLGLIGGTGPESTLIYYREINRRVSERTGGTAFPELIVESVNLNRAMELVSGKRYGELEEYLMKAAENLEKGGAEVLALTAATMHLVYAPMERRLKKPIIGIPISAAEAAKSRGYKKVGLLGTIFTMENDYLSGAFTDRGIEVIVPTKEDRERVNRIISTELEYGVVKETSTEELISVIRTMESHEGIEAVILGCTELPLALGRENCPVDCLDIMDIHIDTLVDLIVESGAGPTAP